MKAESQADMRELVIAAPSSLTPVLIPAIARCRTDWRVRALELPPALLRAHAGENFFQIAITEAAELPKSWASTEVGMLRRALFAPPSVAKKIGAGPIEEDVLRPFFFVGPVYSVGGVHVPIHDDCPAAFDRKLGHQAQTMWLALEIAAQTGQLVFGPAVAARGHVARGELVEIRVRGWDVQSPLFVACNVDRVLATTYDAILEVVGRELAQFSTLEPAVNAPEPFAR
jgi:hypothetical protein